jgi:hypothetical protein
MAVPALAPAKERPARTTLASANHASANGSGSANGKANANANANESAKANETPKCDGNANAGRGPMSYPGSIDANTIPAPRSDTK